MIGFMDAVGSACHWIYQVLANGKGSVNNRDVQ